MNFAANLKRLRIKRNLTQKEFAEIIGTSPSAITMYETGQREPNFTLLDKMATYFEVTADNLLGRSISSKECSRDKEFLIMLDRINSIQLELNEIQNKIKANLQ
jgi:transcriptional regulator with XRE-family HTH domain